MFFDFDVVTFYTILDENNPTKNKDMSQLLSIFFFYFTDIRMILLRVILLISNKDTI